MKVFGRWLIIATTPEGRRFVATSGHSTKREATEALDRYMTRTDKGEWVDEKGNTYTIEKNTKEYK